MTQIRKLYGCALLILGVMLAPAALSKNAIEAFNVVRQGDSLVLKVDLSEPLANAPNGFVVATPPRVVLDFFGVDSALEKKPREVKEGDLISINAIQSDDRTRLVLNLVQPLNYTMALDGKSLLVTLTPAPSATIEAVSHEVAANAMEQRSQFTIQDIAFHRGETGQAQITVDLTDPSVAVDIRKQGRDLVVDFLKATLPDNLRRRMDVQDFATPVHSISTEDKGGNVRMTISSRGTWEHNAYQTENQLVVEVNKVVDDPRDLTPGTKIGPQGPPISINYQNGDVRTLLRLMAEELGFNAVISESVQGTTTLVLKDVPADQVMEIIFQQKGLGMRKNGNVIIIGPREELAMRERQELEDALAREELEPLYTETFQLSYHDVKDFKELLTNKEQRMLSKRGSAVIDNRTNTLFIRDTSARLEELRRVIVKTDVPMRQVMIEARVVEATDNFSKDIGVRFGFLTNQSYNHGATNFWTGGAMSETLKYGGFVSEGGEGAEKKPAKIDWPTANQVNLPAAPASSGLFSFLLANRDGTRLLNLEISALEQDSLGRVVSSPRVLTSDKGTALIEQGTEIPYQEASSAGNTSVEFKKAVLSLEVTPHITPDGRVSMDIKVNKDTPDLSVPSTEPAISTRKVQTKVLVDNGGTVVIGGIYELTDMNGVNKVPLLGDIPVLGFAFRNTTKKIEKRELLVFITPRIVNNNLNVR